MDFLHRAKSHTTTLQILTTTSSFLLQLLYLLLLELFAQQRHIIAESSENIKNEILTQHTQGQARTVIAFGTGVNTFATRDTQCVCKTALIGGAHRCCKVEHAMTGKNTSASSVRGRREHVCLLDREEMRNTLQVSNCLFALTKSFATIVLLSRYASRRYDAKIAC
jgi:hypothetical protein